MEEEVPGFVEDDEVEHFGVEELTESLRVVRYLGLDAVHDAFVPGVDVAGREDYFGVWVGFEEFFGEEDCWNVGYCLWMRL